MATTRVAAGRRGGGADLPRAKRLLDARLAIFSAHVHAYSLSRTLTMTPDPREERKVIRWLEAARAGNKWMRSRCSRELLRLK